MLTQFTEEQLFHLNTVYYKQSGGQSSSLLPVVSDLTTLHPVQQLNGNTEVECVGFIIPPSPDIPHTSGFSMNNAGQRFDSEAGCWFYLLCRLQLRWDIEE